MEHQEGYPDSDHFVKFYGSVCIGDGEEQVVAGPAYAGTTDPAREGDAHVYAFELGPDEPRRVTFVDPAPEDLGHHDDTSGSAPGEPSAPPADVVPSARTGAGRPRQPHGRQSAYPMLSDARTIGDRLNISNPLTIKSYADMAHGVRCLAGTQVDETKDHAYYKSSSRKPPAHTVLNQASRAIREILQPGDCWYTDGSNPRPPDANGHCYARLGVCATTAYGHITFASSKDTESLTQHLQELEEQSMIHTGRRPSLIRMDFGSEGFQQGHGDQVLVAGLRQYLASRPGVRIIPLAPKAQALNKAENAWGVLLALCMRNHVRSNISKHGWSIIMRGTVFQYNRHPVPPSAAEEHQGKLKLEAFTGHTWDASTMLGAVGQGCWITRHGARKNLINSVAEAALYVSPGVNTGGHIVYNLRNSKFTVVQYAMIIHDRSQRAAALARSALHSPYGTHGDTEPELYANRITKLFADFREDADLATVEHEMFTGFPIRVIPMREWTDEDGLT